MYDRFYDISRFCNEANHPAFDGEKIEIRSIVSFRGDPDEMVQRRLPLTLLP